MIATGLPTIWRRSSRSHSPAPLPWPHNDPPSHRRTTEPGRLALRARDRRRQARAADQQLPPPARRGHIRRFPAAAGRVAQQELLDDGPRGDRRGQTQVLVPEALARLALARNASISGGVDRRRGLRACFGCYWGALLRLD